MAKLIFATNTSFAQIGINTYFVTSLDTTIDIIDTIDVTDTKTVGVWREGIIAFRKQLEFSFKGFQETTTQEPDPGGPDNIVLSFEGSTYTFSGATTEFKKVGVLDGAILWEVKGVSLGVVTFLAAAAQASQVKGAELAISVFKTNQVENATKRKSKPKWKAGNKKEIQAN